MLLLRNPVQPYDWGPVDGLGPVVGTAPSGGPEAELWVGTHPKAPSMVVDDPEGRSLADVIATDPARWLGPELAAAGHTALPFLLKVLAIGSSLSLQAHPSPDEAEAGFAREEAAGVALDAPDRTYRDASAKPEALVALVDTWALCGFREPAVAAALVAALEIPALEPLHATLAEGGPRALRSALAWLLHLPGHDRHALATAIEAAVRGADPDDRSSEVAWVRRLAAEHPGDPTCLAPLLLEVVRLAPGDAVHLPAGNLHAYLFGTGVEIMAASDNVLRGGLTSKHIDVDELLSVLRFEPGVPRRPARRAVTDGVVAYDAGEEAFGLVHLEPSADHRPVDVAGPSLLLATGGAVEVRSSAGALVLDHGHAAFVPPGEGRLTASGAGHLWWATPGSGLPA
ncbi:MAG TPA: mannose-6-phosphate isomerase, class I [Aquihabitans sp.]|nr:mannose-6-phosphate isomerase, class I [Aquihabitans sp.]